MRNIKKIGIGILVFVVIWGIAGFFIAPPLLKPFLMEKISAALHRKTVIEKISINPFAVSVTIQGFSLEDPGRPKPFAAFDKLYLKADLTSSLFRRALILKKITLTRPYFGIVRTPDGAYNFSDLLLRGEKKQKPDEKETPFHFSLNNIQIIDGGIDFEDEPKNTKHSVQQINLSVPFISNIEYYLTDYVEPRFSAVINKNKLELVGRTQPFSTSRATLFDINVRDLDIPFYLNYIPVKMNCKLKSARLDTQLKINFIINRDKSPSLVISGDAALRKVILDDLQDKTILQLPSLAVKMASVEPFIPKIHLAQIALDSPVLVIRCDKKGEFNILNLTKKQTEESKPGKEKSDAGPEKKPPLEFLADNVLLDKADVTYIDLRKSEPVNIHLMPLNLKAAGLSTREGETAKAELDCRSGKNSALRAAGTLSLEPLGMNLNFDFKNIAIRAFQPYFTDTVKIDVNSGAVSSAGNFSLSKNKKGELVIASTGDIFVSGLATVDKAQSNDFLKFKNLALNKIRFGYNPLYLHINTVSLADFYARIIINSDASVNIQDIFGKEEKDAEGKAKETAPATSHPNNQEKQQVADIKIGKVAFKNGHIDFSDRNIQPNYSANMLNLSGSVTGLSSKEFSRADVMLRGNLGYGSPIDISGKINPLAKELFADIKVGFHDIELSPVTPYASKYLGYPITRGKLNFDVSYLINKRKLDSQNKVAMDQLTFGEKVESPDAVKAPVTLAAALLTDRNGRINLDLPVSGSLDDPEFRIWPVIWQIIVNLITKAAASPFTLIASLTGGGEELSYVEFDYGSDAVTEEGRKKISLIGKALYDRPNIRLDIEGYADAEKDKAELIKEEFSRRMKAQKLKDTLAKGGHDVTLDQISISGQDYEKYLKMTYKASKFSKPRNIFGMEKDVPPEEIKKLIMADIEITEGDLRGLAARRAQSVKEILLQPGNIGAERIFIVEPSSFAPEKKDKVKDSRINFRLK